MKLKSFLVPYMQPLFGGKGPFRWLVRLQLRLHFLPNTADLVHFTAFIFVH